MAGLVPAIHLLGVPSACTQVRRAESFLATSPSLPSESDVGLVLGRMTWMAGTSPAVTYIEQLRKLYAPKDYPMLKPILALIPIALATNGSAYGQETQVGRYQMVAVPASQSQTFPETLLLDTTTGQSWILYHETGQSIEWQPLRFSAGRDRPLTPLPPSPDAVGVSR
jgi:hypothetical protein